MTQQLRYYTISFVLISILIIGIAGARPVANYEYEEKYILDAENTLDHLWSPDGEQIAFTICPTGQWWDCELWVSDYTLKDPVKIYTGISGGGLFDWYDGWLLIELYPTYPAELNPDGSATSGELWKIRPDGTELTRVTSTQTNGIRTVFWNSAWDGRGTVAWGQFVRGTSLVYFVAHDGNGWWAPHLTTSDGSDQWFRLQPYSNAFTYGYTPVCDALLWGDSWYYNQPTTLYMSTGNGSDGHSVAYLGVKSSPMLLSDCETILLTWPGNDIYAINADGSDLRAILSDDHINIMNTYNPIEGKAFVLTSDRYGDGNYHLFKMYTDNSYMLRMTDGLYNFDNPSYSPDGKYLLYRRLTNSFDPTSGEAYPYQLVVKDLVPTEIGALKLMVDELLQLDHLNKGQANALDVKLDHILKQYLVGHMKPAVNILRALINQVNDFIENGVLSEMEGQNLIYHAEVISEMIG